MNQLAVLLLFVMSCSSATQASINEQDPKVVVENATNQVIDILVKDGATINGSPEKIRQLVDEYVMPYFDFDRISYLALGKVWKTASDQQKADFQTEFKMLLINTYATALSKFTSGKEIQYKKVLKSSKNKNVAMLPTVINQHDSGPIKVDYWMYRTDGIWRIYDVSIDGVSLMKSYRADFAGQMHDNGLQGLIDILHKRNQPVKTGQASQTK